MAARAQPRLLLLSPLPPPTGGIPTWTLGVLGSSLRDRFEIEVVNTSPSQADTVDQRSRFRLGRVGDALRILGALAWKLLRFRPHVVHVNTPYFWAFARDGLAVWIAGLTGARTVLHFRGGDFPEFARGAPALLRPLIAATLRRADRLIALTGPTRDYLVTVVPESRVRWLPNFVNLEDVGEPRDRGAQDGGPVEVLFVGWILEGKGIRELLAAARALPEVRFTLVGPVQPGFVDSIRDEIEAARDHVELLPALPRERVMELYRRADVFVLPTHREGFPNVVLEAMAAGLPVVATPVGAIPDAVRDGQEGVLVPVRDEAALTRALARLVRERELRLALGRRARERAVSVYSRDAVVRELGRLYDELLPR